MAVRIVPKIEVPSQRASKKEMACDLENEDKDKDGKLHVLVLAIYAKL